MAQKWATQDGGLFVLWDHAWTETRCDSRTERHCDSRTQGCPSPHGSGSSRITAGSTLPKPIQSASHKFMALAHPHQHDINNISTKIFVGRDISFTKNPRGDRPAPEPVLLAVEPVLPGAGLEGGTAQALSSVWGGDRGVTGGNRH